MEDKRITKTKHALKSALLELLTTQAFDVISITELCKIANVSRITFYTHYKDKFALLDDIFNDILIIGKEGYHRRQEENNPENNLTQGYLNVLDSILSLYYERYDFFQHVVPETNPYLAFRFYRILLDTVESHTDKLKASYSLKYSARQIAGFICFGLFGFISESYTSKVPLEQVQAGARQLLTDLLQSKILV